MHTHIEKGAFGAQSLIRFAPDFEAFKDVTTPPPKIALVTPAVRGLSFEKSCPKQKIEPTKY